MAGKSLNSLGAKNWAPGSPSTRYNVSGKNREFYTFENAPGIGAYATGGSIIDGGDGYIYHIFTGTGNFTVNRPTAAIDSVDYLIVAGGGAALNSSIAGGGGGGGMLFGTYSILGPGPNPITVGGGGATNPGAPGTPRNGTPSSAFGLTASAGGGGAAPPSGSGAPGGSGGGGAGNAGGAPISPPVTIPRQGYSGGGGGLGASGTGGGGGGAGGPGASGSPVTPAPGGLGGPGRIDPRFPAPIVGGAIPAPWLPSWNSLVGSGGYSAGGQGAPPNVARLSPAYSGYGGQNSGFAGGSGIVCIRYKKNPPYTRATGGIVEPSTDPTNGHPGVWRHIFTSPGTFTITDPSLQQIDYVAVGGGGGGAGGVLTQYAGGGGGGAGGFVSSIHNSTTTPTTVPEAYSWNPGYSIQVGEQMPVSPGSYPVVIGTGGGGGGPSVPGSDGTNTTVGNPGAAQIIAYGGGGGAGTPSAPGANASGRPGGSGGGGCKIYTNVFLSPGGSASPSPFTQGNSGGSGAPTASTNNSGGGGGGGAGGTGATGPAASGGIGWYSVISPPSYGTPGPLAYRYFSGGGGGGGNNNTSPTAGGAGGAGGGGSGVGPVTSGTANTGGGGGGGMGQGGSGASGGSGIVIIQYPE